MAEDTTDITDTQGTDNQNVNNRAASEETPIEKNSTKLPEDPTNENLISAPPQEMEPKAFEPESPMDQADQNQGQGQNQNTQLEPKSNDDLYQDPIQEAENQEDQTNQHVQDVQGNQRETQAAETEVEAEPEVKPKTEQDFSEQTFNIQSGTTESTPSETQTDTNSPMQDAAQQTPIANETLVTEEQSTSVQPQQNSPLPENPDETKSTYQPQLEQQTQQVENTSVETSPQMEQFPENQTNSNNLNLNQDTSQQTDVNKPHQSIQQNPADSIPPEILEQAKVSSKSKVLFIALIVIIGLILVGGAAGYYFLIYQPQLKSNTTTVQTPPNTSGTIPQNTPEQATQENQETDFENDEFITAVETAETEDNLSEVAKDLEELDYDGIISDIDTLDF